MARKARILIIEDDQRTIDLFTFLLRDSHYETVAALGGAEGLRLLKDNGIDLVLLDLLMPEMDGWAVLRAIRADERSSNLPVLIASARHPLEFPRETTLLAGQFDGYLVKPFIVHDLLVQIDEALH